MLIYLSPTVRSVHTLVPFDRRGDRVGRLLTTDHELIRLAAVHGFRTADRTVFAPVLAKVSTGGAALPDTKPGASEGPYEHGSGTLRVLAGSELTDLQPILDQARAATGVTVQLTVTGTLDGVQAVVDGTASRKHDAIWFSSDHYLRLHPETAGRIGTETKIATSPVVFGLRASVAQQLGWDRHRPTWSEIAAAAGERRYTYARSLAGQFARFNGREQVILLPFSTAPGTPVQFDLPEQDLQPTFDRIRAATQALTAGGDTAIYDTLNRAYDLAGQLIAADPDRLTSIVLLTDGERTVGADLAGFTRHYQAAGRPGTRRTDLHDPVRRRQRRRDDPGRHAHRRQILRRPGGVACHRVHRHPWVPVAGRG